MRRINLSIFVASVCLGTVACRLGPTTHSESESNSSSGRMRLRAVGDTWVKRSTAQSRDLPDSDKCLVKKGWEIVATGETPAEMGHVRLTSVVVKSPSGSSTACNLSPLYIFRGHWEGEASQSVESPAVGGESHEGVATLYTTENTLMEGGLLDRCGRRLDTMESFLDGKSETVSVAMDRFSLPYGTMIRIPDIEEKFGRKVYFRVVDTGEAFIDKKFSRMDICVGDSQADIKSDRFGWMSHKRFKYSVVRKGPTPLGLCPK